MSHLLDLLAPAELRLTAAFAQAAEHVLALEPASSLQALSCPHRRDLHTLWFTCWGHSHRSAPPATKAEHLCGPEFAKVAQETCLAWVQQQKECLLRMHLSRFVLPGVVDALKPAGSHVGSAGAGVCLLSSTDEFVNLDYYCGPL